MVILIRRGGLAIFQAKVTTNTIFKRTVGVLYGNLGQSAKLNVAFAAKLPNLMSAKCTTPTVYATGFTKIDQIIGSRASGISNSLDYNRNICA